MPPLTSPFATPNTQGVQPIVLYSTTGAHSVSHCVQFVQLFVRQTTRLQFGEDVVSLCELFSCNRVCNRAFYMPPRRLRLASHLRSRLRARLSESRR